MSKKNKLRIPLMHSSFCSPEGMEQHLSQAALSTAHSFEDVAAHNQGLKQQWCSLGCVLQGI
jgi:hypothetical protein